MTKKQQVVIFDGADRCGKTEMSRALASRLEIPYFKNTAEWDAFSSSPDYFANAMKYGDDFFYRFLRDTGISCVLDRSYPSEWVYSKVYRRKTFNDALSNIDSVAASFGTKIVIPYRSSYAGLKDHVHDIDEVALQRLHDTYFEFSKWTKCEVLELCVDDENLDREIEDILNFMET
jgi:thymidylate kinase